MYLPLFSFQVAMEIPLSLTESTSVLDASVLDYEDDNMVDNDIGLRDRYRSRPPLEGKLSPCCSGIKCWKMSFLTD